MLDDVSCSDIVGWTENGEGFVVKDLIEFTKTVLPQYFKHNNFSSFVRQLNKYDFHKTKYNTDQQETKDIWEFQHRMFKKYHRDMIKHIKRKPGQSNQPLNQFNQPPNQTNNQSNLPNRSIHNSNRSTNQSSQHYQPFNRTSNSISNSSIESNSEPNSDFQHLHSKVTQLEGCLQSVMSQFQQLEHTNTYHSELIRSLIELVLNSNPQRNPSNTSAFQTLLEASKMLSSSIYPSPSNSLSYFNPSIITTLNSTISNQIQPSNQSMVYNQPTIIRQQSTNSIHQQPTNSIHQQSNISIHQQPNTSIHHQPIHQQQSITSYDQMNSYTSTIQQPFADYQPINTETLLKSIKWIKSPRILIVDDDEIYQKLNSKYLYKLGCIFDVVGNGNEAVELVKRGNQYDIVLMDILMPFLDGCSATIQIRSHGCHFPVISVTSASDHGNAETYFKNGMNGILAKPYQINSIASLLEKYCSHLKSHEINLNQDQGNKRNYSEVIGNIDDEHVSLYEQSLLLGLKRG